MKRETKWMIRGQGDSRQRVVAFCVHDHRQLGVLVNIRQNVIAVERFKKINFVILKIAINIAWRFASIHHQHDRASTFMPHDSVKSVDKMPQRFVSFAFHEFHVFFLEISRTNSFDNGWNENEVHLTNTYRHSVLLCLFEIQSVVQVWVHIGYVIKKTLQIMFHVHIADSLLYCIAAIVLLLVVVVVIALVVYFCFLYELLYIERITNTLHVFTQMRANELPHFGVLTNV
mmetsp:Transcript_43776/g.70190  ORF Transcript_43776/g.70190 Transcript_43776/m.70190 type:complete len:230 (-) Transcript_43776:157-846(-)